MKAIKCLEHSSFVKHKYIICKYVKNQPNLTI